MLLTAGSIKKLLSTVLVCSALALPATTALPANAARALDPETFATISSGIVLVRADCPGGRQTGSGFLVGTGVVMTATHVVRGCYDVSVHTTSGKSIGVKNWIPWREANLRDIDVTTMRLATTLDDAYIFHFRTGQAALGSNLAAVGHPLGTDIALTQGKLAYRGAVWGQGYRQVVVRLLGGVGASGPPFLDASGDVVGILQEGYGGKDVIGQSTSGVVSGYDFSSRWAAWRQALCKTHRYGGIADCGY